MNIVEFIRLGIDFAILRRERPFILGLAITDICNLSCRHCRLANEHHRMMSYGDVRAHLESAWRRGMRAKFSAWANTIHPVCLVKLCLTFHLIILL